MASIADALRAAPLPDGVVPYAYKIAPAADCGDFANIIDIVCIVDDYAEWTETQRQAALKTSTVCSDAMRPLGCVALPFLRTEDEHAAAVADGESWWTLLDAGS